LSKATPKTAGVLKVLIVPPVVQLEAVDNLYDHAAVPAFLELTAQVGFIVNSTVVP